MIITVDPSQSEDIAAFAMVKQYRLQALNVTLNGGTGVSAWQAVQGGEGYTQTVVTPVTGIELVYEDPNAIVSYTVENDDTSNYDVASDAGIILSSIEPTNNAWTYTCVFHADSVPVSSVDIDLLVYGNIARGTEQQGSPATAEEITAQVLEGLETRVTALEEEMPDKADQATTYTKSEVQTYVSNALDGYLPMVRTTGNQDIAGIKTFTQGIIAYPKGWHPCATSTPQGKYGIFAKIHPTSVGAYHIFEFMQSSNTASAYGRMILHEQQNAPAPVWIDRSSRGSNDPLGINDLVVLSDGTDLYLAWKRTPPYGELYAREYLGMSYGAVRSQGVNLTWYSNAEATILDNLDDYTVYDIADQTVHTYGNETIGGAKTFTGQLLATGQPAYSAGLPATTVATIGTLDAYSPMVRTTGNQSISGFKTFENAITGTIAIMRNSNINGVSRKVGISSGTGAYKYGSVFYFVTVRDNAYYVSMSSGKAAAKHDNIHIFNLTAGQMADPTTLDWKMGYYIDATNNIYVTITGPSANRIVWVQFMGGSQGGSSGLIVSPTSNDTIPTEDVVQFW